MTTMENSENEETVSWRINDHRRWQTRPLNTTIEAIRSMSPQEVMLKLTSEEEISNMKLVVGEEKVAKFNMFATEPHMSDKTRPVIHIYEKETLPARRLANAP